MIGKRFKRRYTKRVEDDSVKLNAILSKLNKGLKEPQWIPTDGYHAITVVEGPFDSLTFNPASGIVVKAFVNIVTGEVRSYHFTFVAKDKDGKK